jgi:hypothetical protein
MFLWIGKGSGFKQLVVQLKSPDLEDLFEIGGQTPHGCLYFESTIVFLTQLLSGRAVLLLFGLIQKETKRSGTSNRPARKASSPPWMFGPAHVGRWSVVRGERCFLTELLYSATVLLLFGLIQKEAKRSRTSNRPARKAPPPPWMFGPTHAGKLSLIGKSVGSWLFWFGMVTVLF